MSDLITYPGVYRERDPKLHQTDLGVALGGLGTSTLELGRDGAFQNIRLQNDWTGFVAPTPHATFCAVHVRSASGRAAGRVLQLRAPGGLPAVAALEYTGHFPFVTLAYRDPALPCELRLEAFSPFVPRDAESSSVPLIFFTFTAKNPGPEPLTVTAALSWVNHIAAEGARLRAWPAEGNRNTLCRIGGLPAVLMDTRYAPAAGSEYLLAAVPADGVRYQAVADWWPTETYRFIGPGYHPVDDRGAAGWRGFLETGALPPESGYDDGLGAHSFHQPAGAVAGETVLAPGETREIRFALAWFFPHHYDRMPTHTPLFLGHRYAARFPGGTRAVADWAVPRRAALRARSAAWRRPFEEATLPPALRALMPEVLYLLPRISWWLADGQFCLYESIDCPLLHTTILERYMAPVLTALFPELHACALRRIAAGQLESGEIPSMLGHSSVRHPMYRVFNPGDASVFPLALYCQMLWDGDPRFFAELYPVLKKTLQWGLTALDSDGDGVPDARGINQGWDNFPMFGTAAYIADMWMAALAAGERAAQHAGDTAFAETCVAARRRAADVVERQLWNGQYYNLSRRPDTGESSPICFIDQFTYGSVPALYLGLGLVHPPERIRQSLESLWHLNVEASPYVARSGSNPDGTPADCSHSKREIGATQASSFSPVTVTPLCAALIQHGRADRGLALAERMAEVIVRRHQTPWSGQLLFNGVTGDWFYGLHYSDCLILWDLLFVLLGAEIDLWAKRLAFAPPVAPVALPLFGALFCGQVALRRDGEAWTWTLHNLLEAPSSIPTLALRAPGERAPAGTPELLEGQARALEPDPAGGVIARDVIIAPGGRWRLRVPAGCRGKKE